MTVAPRPTRKHGWGTVGPGIDVLPKAADLLLPGVDFYCRFTCSNRCQRALQSLVPAGIWLLAGGARRRPRRRQRSAACVPAAMHGVANSFIIL